MEESQTKFHDDKEIIDPQVGSIAEPQSCITSNQTKTVSRVIKNHSVDSSFRNWLRRG